jgi:alpha-beta hydrolase superfamily lysophospholipase
MPARRALLEPGLRIGAALLVAAPAGGCAWIDLRQRQAVYRPDRTRAAAFTGLGPRDRMCTIAMPAADGGPEPMALWWMPGDDPAAPALLYLHGTFRNLTHNHPKMVALRDAGFSVLGVEYRGWGASAAIVPSERTIYADAWAGWQVLQRLQPDPRRRALFGHSMGGGVAVELAAALQGRDAFGALLLESTFTSLPDVGRALSAWGHPLGWLATQRFDSIDKIGRIREPVLVMHGTDDRTVPFELGRRLYEAVRGPAEFVAIAGGSHSTLNEDDPARYHAVMSRWAERLRGRAATAR